MPNICIVFDRLRSEEKMLQKQALDMGYESSMIDAKTIQLNTDSTGLGDIVLERCISYFRGLHFTSFLDFVNTPVLNSFQTASNCGNKMFMTQLLKKHHVPTPKTYFSFSKDSAIKTIEEVGYPLVIKPVVGSWGRGIIQIKDRDTLDAIIEIRELSHTPYDRIYYLQELVERPPRDIRVITVGGRAIAAMYRKSSGFKTNIALGADPELCHITQEIQDLASRASDAVGGGILGVDMMEGKDGLLVHEVNNTVEFKGLAKVTQTNIPKEIIEFAVHSIRK